MLLRFEISNSSFDRLALSMTEPHSSLIQAYLHESYFPLTASLHFYFEQATDHQLSSDDS